MREINHKRSIIGEATKDWTGIDGFLATFASYSKNKIAMTLPKTIR